MKLSAVLIANRGEIAVRIARAAADLGLRSGAVYSEDDADALHVRIAESAHPLAGAGPAAYLDIERIVAIAVEGGYDAVHPGYGFLAERAEFADASAAAGLCFIGPDAEHLRQFGDKTEARSLARAAGAPVLEGLDRAVSLEEARAFLDALGPGRAMMIKALAGGGGRGARVVSDAGEVEAAWRRCRSEARAAFGREEVYVEAFIARARHIEVQVLGDRTGAVAHLGERECSVQRRFQKIVETAPAPGLDPELRREIADAAVALARSVGYLNLGTFEFLVDADPPADGPRFAFIEANARLQVEHTVTEAVTGVDLVETQFRLADGATLAELGLDDPEAHLPRGHAVQARINLETVSPDGSVRPESGRIAAYEPPGGPGLRVDGFGYAGYRTGSAFDSLLAKLVAHGPDFAVAAARARRALAEFRIEGVATNIPFLANVLAHEDFLAGRVHTRWLEGEAARLAAPPEGLKSPFADNGAAEPDGFAGARVDSRDPLALFAHDRAVKAAAEEARREEEAPPEGEGGVLAPIQGTIAALPVAEGEEVLAGQTIAVIEAMKMEHELRAECSGVVRRVTMRVGDVVREGWPVAFIEAAEIDGALAAGEAPPDPDHIRADLEEARRRHGWTLDENRPEAVARRRALGYRMPRENIARLVDPGSFQEYWPLLTALQHQRYDIETLRQKYPADGVVAGTASINGAVFGDERSRAIVVHYDYTVLAGTQGRRNHYKQDRMFELAQRFRLPVVLFSEGGGGRPGDDDTGPRVAFDTDTFTTFSRLSGLVPLVGINNGRCFAGNTALLACCDVIVATRASTIAMGGPAMIEGGGLGVYTPEEVGPMSFQAPNGVVDILVEDEDEAVDVAKRYLSYFQGPLDRWEEGGDQRLLRHAVPENRVRLYDMRAIIRILADRDSVLELREAFGVGIVTCLIRIEGRPLGVIANNPHHLAGAIDSDGADKAARFLQLCDAFDIPVLSLMDCPGIMVGPDHERTALVRHCARLFNTGANLTAPMFGVIVRKAYGLGVQAMCGASALVSFCMVAWPTAEFAGMNIEGAVKLGFRPVLAAIGDAEERKAEFDRRVAEAYESARAVNAAAGGGLDDVIDPAETRRWIANSMKRLPPPPAREGKKYAFIDSW